MWRFLFIKLFQKEIMTLDANFNKLADEYDKLRQQFNQLEMRCVRYHADWEDNAMLLKTNLKNIDERLAQIERLSRSPTMT